MIFAYKHSSLKERTGVKRVSACSFAAAGNAWVWYRDNNLYATARLACRHGFRLLPPGDVATG